MFKISEKVVCVDGRNPNPNSNYPCGYVVNGSIYCVRGIGYEGGIQIVGKPVIGKQTGLDAGWRPHRFRRLNDVGGSSEPALANEATV
jgi:LytS/YehU family sensor histidine kinase